MKFDERGGTKTEKIQAVPDKKFIDAIYQNLGVTEIDDQAAGVKSLWNRSYLDKTRVGISGTSYGG